MLFEVKVVQEPFVQVVKTEKWRDEGCARLSIYLELVPRYEYVAWQKRNSLLRYNLLV